MEIVSEDGSNTEIKPGQTRELGRANGLHSSDKTISRRQVSFFVPRVAGDQEDVRTRFEVLGRNPIYVSSDGDVKIFRRFERGEMGHADRFCVSSKNPVWYALRKIENEDGEEGVRRNDSESELAGNLETGFESEGVEDLPHVGVDVSDMDPVKEFGFVVIGHEFDSYPKKMIRDVKNWDWFLDEPRKGGQYDDDDHDDDDNEGKRGNKGAKRKRSKCGEEDDDEEWTGEDSEDDKVLIDKSRNTRMMPPQYTTRSNNRGKKGRNEESSSNKRPTRKKSRDYMDDDEDETLGGFIVNDEDEKLDEDEADDDDEEEELVDEDEEN